MSGISFEDGFEYSDHAAGLRAAALLGRLRQKFSEKLVRPPQSVYYSNPDNFTVWPAVGLTGVMEVHFNKSVNIVDSPPVVT